MIVKVHRSHLPLDPRLSSLFCLVWVSSLTGRTSCWSSHASNSKPGLCLLENCSLPGWSHWMKNITDFAFSATHSSKHGLNVKIHFHSQRFSVIITDLVLFLGCKSLAEALPKGQGGRWNHICNDFKFFAVARRKVINNICTCTRKGIIIDPLRHSRASTLTLLIMSNAGLLMVDHVHFQVGYVYPCFVQPDIILHTDKQYHV